jgi:flavin-dependent dehydrogenase
MRARYDVVVLGAGPAGLAAAITIRRETLASVLVADGGTESRERFGECATGDLLVSLKRLGLLDEFRAGAHAACPGSASIWGSDRVGYNDYMLSPLGSSWRLQRRAFDKMLARAACVAGAELRWGVRYLHSQSEQEGHRLLLRAPEGSCEAHGRFVVDATGSAARFAVQTRACRIVDDCMYGLVRYAKVRGGGMTMQTLLEADEDGWWYASRLPDDRVVVLFVGDEEAFRRLRAHGHERFERSLAATRLIGPILAKLAIDEKMYCSTAVYSSRLDRPEGPGWIAAGDAAASYDPIVARGITKALEDGIAAGRLFAEHGHGAGAYGERIAAGFRAYAETRARLYAIERRPGTFWQKRRERSQEMVVRASAVEKNQQATPHVLSP